MKQTIRISPNSVYPIGQAAEELGVHRNTLLRKVKEGKLKCGYRRDSGRKIFHGYELIRFHDANLK